MPYFPPGRKDFNELRHLVLLYGNAAQPWSPADLLFSVAHLRPDGTPDDWLYDSFLFLNVKSSSGRDYCADVNLGTTMAGEGDFFPVCSPTPAGRAEWDELLDFGFAGGGAIPTLEKTLEAAAAGIRHPYGPKRNVVIMLPYPHITQDSFGSLHEGGESLDFSIKRQSLSRASAQRLEAERWFVDQIVRRFATLRCRHVSLLGVYWMFETVYRGWDVDDHWVLKELRRHVNDRGLKFLWIPFWSTYNLHLLNNYRRYYFDLAFLQPNYMFYVNRTGVGDAARAAQRRCAGIEMEYYLELDEPIKVSSERHARFREYLNGGVHYGYMTGAACAHFHGVRALERMRTHENPQEREFYEDIYHFVKGSYRLKPAIPAPTVPGFRRPLPEAALAVDVGGTNLRVALVDAAGGIVQRRSVPVPSSKEGILTAMAALLKDMRRAAEETAYRVAGIGVSTGGRVDHREGEIIDATALLADWKQVPLRRLLESEFRLPVAVDNDGNCSALAEQCFGKGRASANFISIVIGTGIGGGIIVEGELLRGARNAAAEVGHLSIDHEGPLCSCGGRGCVELFASGSGLARTARELMEAGTVTIEGFASHEITARALGEAAAKGNEAAQQLIEKAGRCLGVAVSGLVNVFNPQRVILSGSLLNLGERYLSPLRETVASRAIDVAGQSVEIVLSDLAEPALLGAAALVLKSVEL